MIRHVKCLFVSERLTSVSIYMYHHQCVCVRGLVCIAINGYDSSFVTITYSNYVIRKLVPDTSTEVTFPAGTSRHHMNPSYRLHACIIIIVVVVATNT